MISIIIPARNASDTLSDCLAAISAQEGMEHPFEVIIVDDGSTDDTRQIARGYEARVVALDGRGPAAARNAGAQNARGEILAFTDADCQPARDWLLRLTQPFVDPGVVGVRGVYRTHQQGWMPRFVQQEYAFKYRRMERYPAIDFIDTYSAAYRRQVFLENGGFEETFPVPSVEDQEFSFRMARKGYKMVFAPEAIVFHRHDRNLGEYWRRKFGIGYWKVLLLRWLPERAFADTHTPGSQRAQILLLTLSFFSFVLSLLWKPFLIVAFFCLMLFYLSAIPFLFHLVKTDARLLPGAVFLILVRAAALASGLMLGVVYPTARAPQHANAFKMIERILKRGMDLLGAIAGLTLTAPLLASAALAIKLDSHGPIFFTQERIGQGGKKFKIYKLRTMVVGADQQVNQVLVCNPLQGPVFKVPNDPRVTRAGRFLRRWSVDELPQLWNVLCGQMSLVGPRPEESWVVAQYNDRQRSRLSIKPGLTGPMQVNGRGNLDMEARLALELDYIQNYSIWRDLGILLKSLPAILSGKGAY
jgi:lipopolysaccharide/colanic/teichoic acid biosynthesis glycosyltransferase/glycosyltransferase involved in cell wall biosynthesis